MELDFLKTFVYTKNVDYVKLKFNSEIVYPIYRAGGGGGGVLPYMGYIGMCRWEGYGF